MSNFFLLVTVIHLDYQKDKSKERNTWDWKKKQVDGMIRIMLNRKRNNNNHNIERRSARYCVYVCVFVCVCACVCRY